MFFVGSETEFFIIGSVKKQQKHVLLESDCFIFRKFSLNIGLCQIKGYSSMLSW